MISISAQAQRYKYQDLIDFNAASKSNNAITADYNWHIALIKLTTNNTGQVTRYDILNKVSDSLKVSYTYLLKCKFPAELKMTNKAFLFCEVTQNDKSSCYTNWHATASDAASIIYPALVKQMKANPGTIYMDTILTSAYNETIR